MGIFGRKSMATKLRFFAKLAISRIGTLINQRHVQYSQAKSDIVAVLKLGHQESALLRVGLVIKDQNMIDMLLLLKEYCHLLAERTEILRKRKECPAELKEAVAGLIFASSRCGNFPELLRIREIFVSRYGKDFADRIIEVRNGCGLNPKMVQKLSTQQPCWNSRMKTLRSIATENGIVLHLEEEIAELVVSETKKPVKFESGYEKSINHILPKEITSESHETLSYSMDAKKKYGDTAAAAHEAFVAAAYAAHAARAAVELSQSGSRFQR